MVLFPLLFVFGSVAWPMNIHGVCRASHSFIRDFTQKGEMRRSCGKQWRGMAQDKTWSQINKQMSSHVAEGGHKSQEIGVKINQEINWKICYFNEWTAIVSRQMLVQPTWVETLLKGSICFWINCRNRYGVKHYAKYGYLFLPFKN